MSENHREDSELATAAEQSSEEDEAQTGNTLAEAERSEDSAEHQAMHIEDGSTDVDADLAGLLEALDAAVDPEADAEVDDALDIDLNLFHNKDTVFFPEPVTGPGGVESFQGSAGVPEPSTSSTVMPHTLPGRT